MTADVEVDHQFFGVGSGQSSDTTQWRWSAGDERELIVVAHQPAGGDLQLPIPFDPAERRPCRTRLGFSSRPGV